MDPIRVVTGTGRGPTGLAAYDAALVDAGVGDYNLVRLSSVIPAGADLQIRESAPDLGETGRRLHVVEASARGPDPVGAALSWARAEDGRGVFYEASASGEGAASRARETAIEGVDAGVDLREWTAVERDLVTAAAGGAPDRGSAETDRAGEYHAAVVLAAYGDGEAIL